MTTAMTNFEEILSTRNLITFSIICIVLVLFVFAYRYFKHEKFVAVVAAPAVVTEVKDTAAQDTTEQAIVNETAAVQAVVQANEDNSSIENTPLIFSQNDIYKPVDIDSAKENSFVPPYAN